MIGNVIAYGIVLVALVACVRRFAPKAAKRTIGAQWNRLMGRLGLGGAIVRLPETDDGCGACGDSTSLPGAQTRISLEALKRTIPRR